jgi:hypothetical protein
VQPAVHVVVEGVGLQPEHLIRHAPHHHGHGPPRALLGLQQHPIAHAHVEQGEQRRREHHRARDHSHATQPSVEHRAQGGAVGVGHQGDVPPARPRPRAHGDGALRLDLEHPRKCAQRARVASVHGVQQSHREVVAHAPPEDRVFEKGHGVEHPAPRHEDRHRHRDAQRREREPQRTSQEFSQHHARRGAEPARRDQGLDPPVPVPRRGLGLHRLRGRQRDHRAGRPQRTHHARGEREEPRAGEQREVHGRAQIGDAKELGVEPDERRREGAAEGRAREHPEAHHHHGHLDVVQPDAAVAVAQGLERRHLPALQPHEPPQDHVHEKSRHPEEDHGQRRPALFELRDLLREGAARGVAVRGSRAGAAVGPQDLVHRVDHAVDVGAREHPQREVVEGPLHAHEGREGRAAEPDHRVALVAHGAHVEAAGHDILGRGRRAHHPQRPRRAPEHHPPRRPHPEVMRLREGLADHTLVSASGLREPPAGEVQGVQRWVFSVGQGVRGEHRGLGHCGHLRDAALGDPWDHQGHARQRLDARGHGERRAREGDEDVGESLLREEALGAALEPEARRAHAHVQAHPERDDHGHGEHLRAQAPEVSQQLAVERAHHRRESDDARVAFSVTEVMAPSARMTTRWAMRGDGRVVGDHRGGGAELAVDPVEHVEHEAPGGGVEGARGLVAEQHVGPLGDRARDGHALLLAAGELGGEVVRAGRGPRGRGRRRGPSGRGRSR